MKYKRARLLPFKTKKEARARLLLTKDYFKDKARDFNIKKEGSQWIVSFEYVEVNQ
jgi:hypothetical protein